MAVRYRPYDHTLNEDAGAEPEGILRNVHMAVDRFVGTAEQFDDITMLCLEYRGADGVDKK